MMLASTTGLSAPSRSLGIGRGRHAVVVLGRSKERSDAAQTLGSMPRRRSIATVQNSVRSHSPTKVMVHRWEGTGPCHGLSERTTRIHSVSFPLQPYTGTNTQDPGSSRRRFAAASPWNDEADRLPQITAPRGTPSRAVA
ncbi:MAG: hypothetical protein E5Y01_17530 [Mesorhizobium sp.]|nr:MAG: hypothetical protein EOR74_33005 [Mesorhizobium sp.]RWM37244.1 MAG: hypothetical protein EOR75_20235 [Mesorhizobium sp.]TJV50871.1 MAG: hypothetical protein E5Y01_17530 [Mesorhizobium sp.]